MAVRYEIPKTFSTKLSTSRTTLIFNLASCQRLGRRRLGTSMLKSNGSGGG